MHQLNKFITITISIKGLKSLKDAYGDMKERVASNMANASSPWMKKGMIE